MSSILDWFFSTKSESELKNNASEPKNNVPTCTYCGGTEFYEGPSGGMSTNILCANKECRHWFNHTPILGSLDDLNHQEPTEEEKEQERKNMKGTMNIGAPRMRVKLDVLYQEGAELFIKGKSARDCLQQNTTGDSYEAAHSDILRLTGYIDAQREAYKDVFKIINKTG